MKYDTIEINKELVPYSFSILLCGELFDFIIDYNESYGFFTAGLSKNGKTICSGEKIVYGKPLFETIYEYGKFPDVEIIPFDISGDYKEVTFDNLSETVHLILNNKENDLITV